MPEGPSIVILKESAQEFIGKRPIEISGNTKVDFSGVLNQKITDFKSFGKNFFICFKNGSIKIHFMLFGSYRVNERKETPSRLSLHFADGELNFYACSVKLIEGDLSKVYDWSADVMNENWSAAKARKKLKEMPNTLVCDALLDQTIFAGVGNIIKNEVLFRIKVHPKTKVGNLPSKKLSELIKEARQYSFDFLEWKKQYVLKKHWLAHTKKICPRDGSKILKEYLGKTNRRTFYCNTCQELY
ncbi:MAG TPA: DNA-formamidopyrimidine glycosylase family protein [Chitinophagaceae bacterium]|jgi:endonuclease VIII|nr:DNA-formamidopyrimidine glycosylase family protein [Chitinophagaceae bacterium]